MRSAIANPEPPPYDVAISFLARLARDEQLATTIADELSKTLEVFIFSKRQEELAGREGDLAFGEIFRKGSRVALALYRPQWGETPWTREEREAIRARAHAEGWGFCLIVPLEGLVPEYVPEINIWFDFERYGVAPLSAIMARMAQEHGSRPRPDTAAARAARLAHLEEFAARREQYRRSQDCGPDRRASFRELRETFTRILAEINNAGAGNMRLELRVDQSTETSMNQNFVVLARSCGLLVHLYSVALNSLEGLLRIEIFDGRPPLPGVFSFRAEQRPVQSREFEFDLTPSGLCWVERNRGGREFTSAALTDEALKELLTHQEAATRERAGRR